MPFCPADAEPADIDEEPADAEEEAADADEEFVNVNEELADCDEEPPEVEEPVDVDKEPVVDEEPADVGATEVGAADGGADAGRVTFRKSRKNQELDFELIIMSVCCPSESGGEE